MLILGIGGGSGSGKTYLAEKICSKTSEATRIPMDRYYRPFTHLSDEERKQVNFDHPETIDWDLLKQHIEELKKGNAVEMPIYSFEENTRKGRQEIEPGQLVVIEGIHAFRREELNELMDLKIFLDVPADVRAVQRLRRDVKDRGRKLEFSAEQYLEKTREAHKTHIEPTKQEADQLLGKEDFEDFARVISKKAESNDTLNFSDVRTDLRSY